MATRKRPGQARTTQTTTPAETPDEDKQVAGRPDGSDFPVVGIGASAGGLEAFEQFFHALPADSGMGFVVVQHLDPSHSSMLTEILQRATTMPVVEADDHMPILANRVHVIPPNRDMVVFHGALLLSVPTEPRGQRMPIDAFLRSLAEDQGDNAVGIILSGTGTDGTLGLRAIFGAGGLCLVQDPASAKYDGMPTSAINAGYASHVLPADQMPLALVGGVRFAAIRQAVGQDVPAGAAVAVVHGLTRILAQLRSATGHDFSQYKKSTIGRRVERRMAQHNIENIEVYARFIKEHPDELQQLLRELLINVTSFFRDPQAFAALKDTVLPELLSDKPENHVLRVWVAGCATGEEAYSIAIVLRELMDQSWHDLKVQLYGTDLDDDAVTTARAGLYPPNIAQDISPERLRRFFNKEEAGYRVKKEIREMVVFAVQSVIKDPPFTRLDLLSCRNLLIYLEPVLQDRLIPAFHYALRPGGALMLSPSESIGNHIDLFEPIDRRWKIYRAKRGTSSTRAVLGSGLSWASTGRAAPAPGVARQPKEPQLADLARRALLQAFCPAAVMTDLQGNVLFVHGDTGRYLRPAPGHPTHNVVEMAREGLQADLRDALQRAASKGESTLRREVTVHANDQSLALLLDVRPLTDPEPGQTVLLVSFHDVAAGAPVKAVRRRRATSSQETQRVQELERELVHARENLSTMLEEQQASNEELKSTNEELQSTNEELQSTNEELETSKEELQSVNEELMTVNAELQSKIEQMSRMQDDMKNLLDNMHVGTIFLDRHLAIRRFTREATRVFRLMANDLGRPLADIRSDATGADLIADAQAVLDTLVPVERELLATDGIAYLARIQPYRTLDNVIDGVVLTFADVTERVRAIATRKALAIAEATIETVHMPLLVTDAALNIVSANAAFYKAFGGNQQNTVGHNIFGTGNGQWDFPALRDLLETVLPRERGFERHVLQFDAPGGVHRHLQFSARRIADQPGDGGLVLLAIETVGPQAG